MLETENVRLKLTLKNATETVDILKHIITDCKKIIGLEKLKFQIQ
jgi:hypothetical protein